MPITYTIVRRNVDVMAEGGYQREFTRVVFTFISDGAGDATVTTTERFTGEVVRICTVPDGVAALWDAYVYDDDGLDVANGQAINRSAVVPQQVHPTLGGGGGTVGISNTRLRCVVDECGQVGEGEVIVYII